MMTLLFIGATCIGVLSLGLVFILDSLNKLPLALEDHLMRFALVVSLIALGGLVGVELGL